MQASVPQMQWQPNQEGINGIINLLRDSQSTDINVQKNLHQKLQTFNSIPDYNNYLVYIFARLKNEPDFIRTVAGLVLKNNIREYFTNLAPEVQQYIKNEVLLCIGDPIHSVRKTVGSIISAILSKGGLGGWLSLIPSLIQCLESNDLNYVEGSFHTLAIICEDYAHKLDSIEIGRPLNDLIPKILPFFKSPHQILRKHAITCLNQFILSMPNALLVNMQEFLQGLFFLTSDSSGEIQRKVCSAFVMFTEVRIDYILPHINGVIQYMIHSNLSEDEDVALEACEFWQAIAETKVCKEVLLSHLPHIVPVLLEKMAYSDDDAALIGAEEEDELVPDQSKDIKPFFHTSKSKSFGGLSNSQQLQNLQGQQQPVGNDDDDDDEDDEDDDDDDDSGEVEWNIRKCAAAGIDILSLVFQDTILPYILTIVQVKLNNKDNWKMRESAVLTLGAIAEGCLFGIKEHLKQLIPYLITLLSDQHPLIRSITCWTLSRYAKWIVRQRDDELLKRLVFEMLKRILDKNKKVQEAACSAFASLEEEAREDLVPYLDPILKTLMMAFSKYQAKNLLILYDTIGTLADSVRYKLAHAQYVNILMPPLIMKWNSLSDEDKDLIPLLECLTSISTALEVEFQHFAVPVYQRCLKIIENTIVKEAMSQQNQCDVPDPEFMVCALDLISGMIDGLQNGMENLVANSNLISLLFQCTQSPRPDVRQSAFAMVGDLTKSCFVHLRQHINDFLIILAKNLVSDFVAVCNNACWAIGEIALRIGEDIKPYVPAFMEKLLPLINRTNLNSSLLENVAITIGRLGFASPSVLSPLLGDFVHNWCLILREMRDDPEKDSAFRGFIKLIKENPNGIVNNFVYFCEAVISWEKPEPDLKESFSQILHGFKNSMQPQAWNNYVSTFPPQLRDQLKKHYDV